jgi:hypothetical protein
MRSVVQQHNGLFQRYQSFYLRDDELLCGDLCLYSLLMLEPASSLQQSCEAWLYYSQRGNRVSSILNLGNSLRLLSTWNGQMQRIYTQPVQFHSASFRVLLKGRQVEPEVETWGNAQKS